MANVKISALPPAVNPNNPTSIIPVAEGAATVGITVQNIVDTVEAIAVIPVARMAATGTPDGTTYLRGDGSWSTPAGGGGPGAGWATYLCAALEPDAIEPTKINTFSYAVASNETKLLIASWQTRLGASGRMEVRDPGQGFVPLRGVTLAGTGSGSCAIIVDPTIPTYADAWATYYERLQTIAELPVRYLPFTGTSQKKLLLPGPYGSVITSYTCFDLPWLAIRPLGGSTVGFNLGNEESDTHPQRIGNRLLLTVNKNSCAAVFSDDTAGGSPSGAITWVNLPSDWSAVPDPNSYVFRDTFEAASLDTGVWTRATAGGGSLEIDTTYNWLKCTGKASWGGNAVFRTTGTARSTEPVLIVDFAMDYGTEWEGFGVIGWHDGAGDNHTDIMHGVNIGSKGGGTTAPLSVLEAGSSKSTGLTVTEGAIYRLRITALASGGATYEIQGGPEFDPIGGATWDTITPSGGSSGSTATLHPAYVAFGNDQAMYLGDFRVL